ncbi:hypothetical protein [Curvibacter fontanus]
MRRLVALTLVTTSPSAFARGADGWGWLIVGAPFILLIFAVLGGFSDQKSNRRGSSDSASLLVFMVAVFVGIPVAIFCAELLAEILGIQRKYGVWILLLIELALFIPYAVWLERRKKSKEMRDFWRTED